MISPKYSKNVGMYVYKTFLKTARETVYFYPSIRTKNKNIVYNYNTSFYSINSFKYATNRLTKRKAQINDCLFNIIINY